MRIAVNPLIARSVGPALLIVSGAVVLGISAYIEVGVSMPSTSTRVSHTRAAAKAEQAQWIGVQNPLFIYDAFVGGFAVLAELLFVGFRLWKKDSKTSRLVSLRVEGGLAFLLFALWTGESCSRASFVHRQFVWSVRRSSLS